MTIEEIKEKVAAAFPEHEVEELSFDHEADVHGIHGLAKKGVNPQRIRLRLERFAYDDHCKSPRFRDKVAESIEIMKTVGGAIIYRDDNNALRVRPEAPHWHSPSTGT